MLPSGHIPHKSQLHGLANKGAAKPAPIYCAATNRDQWDRLPLLQWYCNLRPCYCISTLPLNKTRVCNTFMKKYLKLRKKIIKTNKIGLLMKAARNASEIDNMQSWNTFNTIYANFISKSLSIYLSQTI